MKQPCSSPLVCPYPLPYSPRARPTLRLEGRKSAVGNESCSLPCLQNARSAPTQNRQFFEKRRLRAFSAEATSLARLQSEHVSTCPARQATCHTPREGKTLNAQALTKETYAIPRLRKFSREALTPRMAGLMLSKAWVYVLFLAPLGVLEGPPVTTAAEFGSASRYMLIATLLGGAFLLSKRANAIPQNALAVLPGITSALGCLALVLAPMTPEATRTIVMAAAALTGIGSGILALMWGAVYSKVGAPTTAAEASLAFGLATLLVPGYSLCPSWTQFCIVIALPLGSSALLALVLNREQNVLEEDGANPADVKDKTEPGDLTNSAPPLSRRRPFREDRARKNSCVFYRVRLCDRAHPKAVRAAVGIAAVLCAYLRWLCACRREHRHHSFNA